MPDQAKAQKTNTKLKIVMISSTARDLPEHRKEVEDACLRQGMFPEMMEHLPASDDEAIRASFKLVDGADIYVGIFAHRYGHVPKGHPISITEMEYNRAVERKIPRCIFVMHEDHPIKAADVEKGEGAAKLDAFKKRLFADNIVNSFKSPADLRADVINSLSQHREPDITQFHYVSDIPAPPEAYIAHPYTLLQTHRLVGRQVELNLLTDWVTKPNLPQVLESAGGAPRILTIVAIGGMGKSALTWKWFNDIAPQEMKPLAGRMWWSFYESDASFENFIIRALAYVTQQPREEVEKILPPDRETQLLAVLDHEPFLLVLDGLERILIAYARMDASRLADDQIGIQKNLRKTADPRTGSFLKKLAQVRNSRILISTRLYPAILETETGNPIPGVYRHDISGLTDNDAVELWRAFDVSGSRDELLPIFTKFDKHPLLIQALAGEVKKYRRAPGDFAAWRKANPHFDPAQCPSVIEAMAHVLLFALRGLDKKSRKILETVSAFRMPTGYDTLAALFLGNPSTRSGQGGVLEDERELDAALRELEDRGLVGWDKRANRYDLHPIVRGVVWSGLPREKRNGVFISLQVHFESVPKIDKWQEVNCLEDLTPAIELYNTLIGLERNNDAYVVFRDFINQATLYRLSANRPRSELLEALFPEGVDQLPCLSQRNQQAITLNSLAQAYDLSGQPGLATPLFHRHNEIQGKEGNKENLSVGLDNLSYALQHTGALRESESSARCALIIGRELSNRFRESISLFMLGLTLTNRGVKQQSISALKRSLRVLAAISQIQFRGVINTIIAQRALWFGDSRTALLLSDRAWELAHNKRHEADYIRAARVQGTAALGLNDFTKADERLHHALTRSRVVNLVEDEQQALVALAELRRRQKDLRAARELLDDVWELAERGPYPLFHADAFNVLAQIERDAGNHDKAVEAATKAYRLAWCDGPPFAYHWGLEAAKKHLKELGAPEPEMPPFDESNYEPMPEVEINPKDEFYVDLDEKELEK